MTDASDSDSDSDSVPPQSTPPIRRRRRKRPRSPSPPPQPDPPSDDTNVCIVCLEPYTSTGSHQICCLPCGHLFGYDCIHRWITQSSRNRHCPQCKTYARIRDIRYIFGVSSALTVTDNSRISELERELKQEREKHQVTKAQLKEVKRVAKGLRESLALLNRNGATRNFASAQKSSLTLLKTTPVRAASRCISFDPGGNLLVSSQTPCRIMRFDPTLSAANSSPTLSPRAIHAMDVQRFKSTPAATMPLVATADKRVSVLTPDLSCASVIDVAGIPMSVCWRDEHSFAVGFASGDVSLYDVRQQGTLATAKVAQTGWKTVHSLATLSVNTATHLLAAAPCGLYEVSFSDSLQLRKVETPHGRVMGLTTSSSMLALNVKSTDSGPTQANQRMHEQRICIYSPIMPDLGECQGMIELQVKTPFSRAALLSGEGARVRGSVVMAPDAGVVGAWGHDRNAWQRRMCMGGEDVECVAALHLPREASIRGVERGSTGLFGGVRDGGVVLWSAGFG